MYRIKNWNETFENADTRKRVRLGWFLCPSGVESQGYVELMSHGQAGIEAFAVFIAICQWSATCLPVVRGSCARSDGRPMSSRQISAQIRMPLEVVERSLNLLCRPEIGWIINENAPSADHLPVICQSSAGCLPQGEGEGEGEGEGSLSVCNGRSEYSEDFEKFWDVYPKLRRTKKKEAFRKWKVALRAVEASTLIRRAAEYAASEVGRSEFAVMPTVWLNGGMWEDEPEAWERKSGKQLSVGAGQIFTSDAKGVGF